MQNSIPASLFSVHHSLDLPSPPVQYVYMRLTVKQQTEILRTVAEEFGPDATVTLFGSRTDDAARGGDIDLMITTGLDSDTARRKKIRFLVRLKQRIGDRRIDVVLRTPDSGERAIHRVASTEGVTIQ